MDTRAELIKLWEGLGNKSYNRDWFYQRLAIIMAIILFDLYVTYRTTKFYDVEKVREEIEKRIKDTSKEIAELEK